MISKLFIALSVLALTSSVNAAAIPHFARQAGDLKLSSPAASSGSSLLKGILLNAGKAGAGEVASIAEVDLKSTFFAPTSATIPAAAPATTSASAAGLSARQVGDLKLPPNLLNKLLDSGGKAAASVLAVHAASAFFAPASATVPVSASATTSASAAGLFARQDDSAELRVPSIKLPPAAPSTINNVLTGPASIAGAKAAYYIKGPTATTA